MKPRTSTTTTMATNTVSRMVVDWVATTAELGSTGVAGDLPGSATSPHRSLSPPSTASLAASTGGRGAIDAMPAAGGAKAAWSATAMGTTVSAAVASATTGASTAAATGASTAACWARGAVAADTTTGA